MYVSISNINRPQTISAWVANCKLKILPSFRMFMCGKVSLSIKLFMYSRKVLALVLANLWADRTKTALSKSSFFFFQ